MDGVPLWKPPDGWKMLQVDKGLGPHCKHSWDKMGQTNPWETESRVTGYQENGLASPHDLNKFKIACVRRLVFFNCPSVFNGRTHLFSWQVMHLHASGALSKLVGPAGSINKNSSDITSLVTKWMMVSSKHENMRQHCWNEPLYLSILPNNSIITYSNYLTYNMTYISLWTRTNSIMLLDTTRYWYYSYSTILVHTKHGFSVWASTADHLVALRH